MQRAVVLYVHVLMPAAMRFFPAVSKSQPPAPAAADARGPYGGGGGRVRADGTV